MTRRGRLSRLESQRRREDAGDAAGIFEADPGAGVWREAGGGSRTLPLSPEDLREAGSLEAAGGGLLMLAPAGRSKIIPGLAWGDL